MANHNPTWLHISDLHIGKDIYGAEILAKNLFSFLKQKKDSSGFNPHVIFFTGDIANRGKSSEYAFFHEHFLFPLVDLYGNDAEQKLIFVPGNHDVDRDKQPLLEAHSLYDKHPTLFDLTAAAGCLRESLIERFSAFRDALPNPKDFDALTGQNLHFVRIVNIGVISIGILGINTAWLSQSPEDKDKLTPGRYAVMSGLEAIKNCPLRIVVGHHPVSWMRNDEMDAIKALFAQNSVIYLHGHLHETVTSYQDHAGADFLSIQAGAIFDARESKTCPNTIVMGEFDSAKNTIILEPHRWNPSNQEWALAADGMPAKLRPDQESRWHFPLPTHKTPVRQPKRNTPQLPAGWTSITRSNVATWTASPLSSHQVLSYFDGRAPNWNDAAASIQIPHRKIVADIVNDVVAGLAQTTPSVLLLTGPGGEGKSTALKQVCCAVLRREPNTKLLFRNDDETDLSSEYVLNDLSADEIWFIVADEASNLAQSIQFQTKILSRNQRLRLVYLIAARDTDWIADGGKSFKWNATCNFKEYHFRGLDIEDAKAVVTAWSQYGKPGLQRLSGRTLPEAAQLLLEASKLEAETTEGAFLGAMLRVRYGKELNNHIDAVLERLQTRPSVAGHSLLEAFAAIVAMHRIRLPILTKSVLAAYLGGKESEIRKYILNPLGDEAVVAIASQHLVTRHRAIADASYELLEAKYDYQFSEVYKGLVTAAMQLRLEGKYVSSSGKWLYLSKHLNEAGESSMAIEVAERVVSLDPTNTYLIVHLASLRRSSGNLDLALKVFRDSKIDSDDNRAFFTEWGAAERTDGNFYASFWISCVAIADQQGAHDVTNDDAKMALNQLVICGRSIFERFNLKEFLTVALVAKTLALKLPLNNSERDTFTSAVYGMDDTNIHGLTIFQLIEKISSVARLAKQLTKTAHNLPSTSQALSFESLTRLLLNLE